MMCYTDMPGICYNHVTQTFTIAFFFLLQIGAFFNGDMRAYVKPTTPQNNQRRDVILTTMLFVRSVITIGVEIASSDDVNTVRPVALELVRQTS